MSFFFLLSSTSLSSAAQTSIAEITQLFNERPYPGIPQEYWDDVYVEYQAMTHIMGYTHTAVQDGDWTDTSTWNTGTVPGLNSVVQVGNYDVVYDGNSTVKIKDIHVGALGSLTWPTDQDTLLWVDTIMCMGRLIMGTEASPITESSTSGKARAEIVFHQHTAPGTTTRLGIMTMGPVRIHGARKADRLTFNSVSSGATSVTVPGVASSGWRVGDTIIFMATTNAGTSATDDDYGGPTQFYGPNRLSFDSSSLYTVQTQTLGFHQSHDEVRTITAISGDTISWTGGLSHNHTSETHTFANGDVERAPAYVANVSRSIKFRSESTASLQHRAHAMFMHNDDVDIRYLEVFNMGRQASDPSQVRPEGIDVLASDGGSVITDSNNVRGRYALHIHKTGQYFGRKQVRVVGCAVHAGPDDPPIPGWAMVHHNSRASFEENVVYNVRGAGMVAEVGNEIGQWINNTVMWCRGDGFPVDWGTRQEYWTNHNGHAGVAYEMQARQIFCKGNISSSSHFGWLYLQQITNIATRIPDEHSLRYFEPITSGYGIIGVVGGALEDKYGVEQAQIPTFEHNYVYGSDVGFSVGHRQFTDRFDMTPAIFRHFHCINVKRPVRLINYAFIYAYYNSIWIGPGGTQACTLGGVAWQFTFGRIYLENYSAGFVNDGIGLNYDGLFIDIESDSVTTLFGKFDVDWDLTAWNAANPGGTFPDDHDLYEIMGPWTEISSTATTWAGTVRQYANVDSSTDLPLHIPAWPDLATEPSPGTPKPYFTLNASSDTTLNGKQSLSLWGIITDSVGNRRWPDWKTSESFDPLTTHSVLNRINYDLTAQDIVERNGCFYDEDAAAWKVPLWFTSYDRLTSDYFQFRIDVTIASGVVPAGALTANEVDPTIPPESGLVPERTPWQAITFTHTAPTVTLGSAYDVDETVKLEIPLKADTGYVDWTLTGTDAAQFEVGHVDGLPYLRWASDGSQDFEAPLDDDEDNVYEVNVVATAPGGAATTTAVSVTVNNVLDIVVDPFTENFSGFSSGDDLAANSINWLRSGGTAGAGYVNQFGEFAIADVASEFTAYKSPPSGNNNMYVQAVNRQGFNFAFLCVALTDNDNWIGIKHGNNTTINLVKCVAGTRTTIANFTASYSNGQTLRLEYKDGTATVLVNSSSIGSSAVSGPPPASQHGGIVVEDGVSQGQNYDNFETGSIPFVPDDLADLVLWVDASDASTITESSGSVSAWANKGSGADLTQATAGLQPTTGTDTINSLNVLAFSGSNMGAALAVGGDRTVFIVGERTDTDTQCQLELYTGDRWALYDDLSGTGAPRIRHWDGASTTSLATASHAVNTPYIIFAQQDGSRLEYRLNNEGGDFGFQSGSSATSDIIIGDDSTGGDDAGIRYAEILVYDALLSTADANKVGAYLSAKWGITWTDLT